MNTKTKGSIGELILLQKCLEKGYVASVPYGDYARYDLIIDTGLALLRTQVKYVTPKNGTLVQSLYTVQHNNKRLDEGQTAYTRTPYTSNEIDAVIIVDANTKLTYFVPSSVFLGLTGISLRIDTPKNETPNIRWAKDYLVW